MVERARIMADLKWISYSALVFPFDAHPAANTRQEPSHETPPSGQYLSGVPQDEFWKKTRLSPT
jgi:hypothetical protein